MNIRLLLLVLAEVLWLVPAKAVLKEKDLNSSLAVLRHELTTYHREQQDREFNSTMRTQRVTSTLRDIMQRSAQNSLMLYSQKNDYVFDLTYACHEATEQYQDFRRQIMPFKDFVNRSNSDIAEQDAHDDAQSAGQGGPQRLPDAGREHTPYASGQQGCHAGEYALV